MMQATMILSKWHRTPASDDAEREPSAQFLAAKRKPADRLWEESGHGRVSSGATRTVESRRAR